MGARQDSRVNTALWTLMALYAAARVLQAFPETLPMPAIVALHVVPAAAFALIHGALRYRWRGIIVFAALCLLVSNISENLSILTGFPFGHYHFTDVMGPKVLNVPILLGLAYVGMGYVSWTLGGLILGDIRKALTGLRVFTVPLAASSVMVAWDLSMDPVWSTVVHGWIWHQGGAYFGVPTTNFLGWYLTVFVVYQLFAWYLRRRPSSRHTLPPNYWKLAIIFYGVSAAGNFLVIPAKGPSVVSDPSGALWKLSDILAASAVATVCTMGAFTILAWVRLANERSEAGSAPCPG